MSIFTRFARLFGGHSAARQVATDEPRPIRARYDAAQQGGMNEQHWAAADALDADTAHSVAIRRRLSYRSRMEIGNNGYAKGTQRSISNFVVGRGPKLRMLTGNPAFNRMIEARWQAWAKAVKLARKLRTARKVQYADGESFLVARTNPALGEFSVQLDIVGVECERVTTPYLGPGVEGRIDGIDFDAYDNPVTYHILRKSPGASMFGSLLGDKTDPVPARFVCHLFGCDRWEHRAVPESTSTLNLFAVSRRYREATVVAAENIANISLVMKTQTTPSEGADEVRPFSSVPFEKGTMVFSPMGYDVTQPRAEQPSATYPEFTRAQIAEQVRPAGMSYGLAACDSSGASFSSAKLDHLSYFFGQVEVDQADIEEQACDPLFALWFAEAVKIHGWNVPTSPAPAHDWDWPAKPEIDETKAAEARGKKLSFGGATLSRVYAEQGLDFEDEIAVMAADYGVTVEELRARLLQVNLSGKAAAAPQTAPPDDSDELDEPPPPPRRNAAAARNGNRRAPV